MEAPRGKSGRFVVVLWVPRLPQSADLSVGTPIYAAVVAPRVVHGLLPVCPPLAGREIGPVTRERSIECGLKERDSVTGNTPSAAGVCSLADTDSI